MQIVSELPETFFNAPAPAVPGYTDWPQEICLVWARQQSQHTISFPTSMRNYVQRERQKFYVSKHFAKILEEICLQSCWSLPIA